MAPSVLSALYSSVLPAYIDLLKTRTPDDALDEALALVNNVSKKRLLNNVGAMKLLLLEMEPEQQSEAESGNTLVKLLGKEMKDSVQALFFYRQPENRTISDQRFRKQRICKGRNDKCL